MSSFADMLNRINIVQRLIGVTRAKNYLEIGVNNGKCFLRVRASGKMAVDPSFRIPAGRKLKYFVKNPWNFFNRYFEKTSDDFFSEQQEILVRNKPKVVFVDGLHTYEQSLRDVLNSLSYLEDGGVILMHDCNPVTEAAGLPAQSIDHAKGQLSDYSGIWNGDVWKAVVHMRALRPDLEVFVLDCDHGIGVVRKGNGTRSLTLSEDQVKSLSYNDLQRDREKLLDLRPPAYFDQFIQRLAS